MKIGTVCYSCCQGLGYLAKSFYDAKVVTDVMVFKHPHGDRPSHMEWYPPGTIELTKRPFVGESIERWLDDLDAVLFFETPFCWKFADRCRERGVKTVLMTMYEWSLINPPHKFDKYLCPSLLDLDYFPEGEFIPVPAPQSTWLQGTWLQRTVAKRFLHNSGHIGSRNHKGTLELLLAMQYVKSPIDLTIRSQFGVGLNRLIASVPGIREDKRVTFVTNEVPYESLFGGFDVLVAPEKYNGLSLPLQEAYAAGMLVITTDRYPINTWLPAFPLIPVGSTRQVQVAPGHQMIEESIVSPIAIAAMIDEWYGQDITSYSQAGREYALANSFEILKPRYLKAIEEIL